MTIYGPGQLSNNQFCLYAPISVASMGNNVVIAGVAGESVRILGLVLSSAGAVTLTIKEDVSTTALTGAMSLITGVNGLVLPPSQLPWIQTSVGNGINLSLSSGVQISGVILYVQG